MTRLDTRRLSGLRTRLGYWYSVEFIRSPPVCTRADIRSGSASCVRTLRASRVAVRGAERRADRARSRTGEGRAVSGAQSRSERCTGSRAHAQLSRRDQLHSCCETRSQSLCPVPAGRVSYILQNFKSQNGDENAKTSRLGVTGVDNDERARRRELKNIGKRKLKKSRITRLP